MRRLLAALERIATALEQLVPAVQQATREARTRETHMAEKSADDLLYLAWGVIANAGFKEGDEKTPGWHEAAVRWRDDWHEYLESAP